MNNSRYSSDVLKVTNKSTNLSRYYLSVCGEFVRISKNHYDEISDNCDGVSSLIDKSTKTHRRSYSTRIFYIS